MAVLSDADRAKVNAGLMRFLSANADTYLFTGLTKNDLRAAVNSTDSWIDSNQSSYNSALPAAAQSNLTAAEKTLLFCAVALMRVDIELARRVFEVD